MNAKTIPTQTNVQEPLLSEELRKRIVLEDHIKKLSRPNKFNRTFRWIAVFVAVATPIDAFFIWLLGSMKEDWRFLFFPIAIAIYFLIFFGFEAFMRSKMRSKFERELATMVTTQKSEELKEKLEENFFTNLVKINFKYIDQYYFQTQLQADKSFLLCAVAASISLLVILAGIVMLFFKQTGKDAGYVATAAGTLGEFIAAVFFYLYNRTITKMSEYHQKLVLTQNVSLALKISEELPAAEQVIARCKLIDYLSKDINLFLTGGSIVNVGQAPQKTTHK